MGIFLEYRKEAKIKVHAILSNTTCDCLNFERMDTWQTDRRAYKKIILCGQEMFCKIKVHAILSHTTCDCLNFEQTDTRQR